MKGVDLRSVQSAMGHKTISMTCRYAHLAPEHEFSAVERLCETEIPQNGTHESSTDTRTGTGAVRATAGDVSVVH
jgi:Phage integrase family